MQAVDGNRSKPSITDRCHEAIVSHKQHTLFLLKFHRNSQDTFLAVPLNGRANKTIFLPKELHPGSTASMRVLLLHATKEFLLVSSLSLWSHTHSKSMPSFSHTPPSEPGFPFL